MPQCKKNYCKNQAIYHRRWGNKRYCEEHGHAYADRRDRALAVRENFPDCQSGISSECQGKVSMARQEYGHTICHMCEKRIYKRVYLEVQREREYESLKEERLNNAKTLEELKTWIRDYIK